MDAQLPGTNLGTKNLVSGNLMPSSDSKYRLLSLRFTATWLNIVALADGGAMFGVAHGDYSATEIEECIEATASINLGDKIANEKANRLVRVLGTFPSTRSSVADSEEVWNDGRMSKVKLNWVFPIGKSPVIWIYNQSETFWTTGSTLNFQGTAVVAYS